MLTAPIRPALTNTLTEVPRAGLEAARLLCSASNPARGLPRGDGPPVRVLPAYGLGDFGLGPLRRFLENPGYAAHPPAPGINLERGELRIRRIEDAARFRRVQSERVAERARAIHAQSGRRASLVGWSVGGPFAYDAARLTPDVVRSVVTLGSPFGDPCGTSLWEVMRRISGSHVPPAERDFSAWLAPIPCTTPGARPPVTILYGRRNGSIRFESRRFGLPREFKPQPFSRGSHRPGISIFRARPVRPYRRRARGRDGMRDGSRRRCAARCMPNSELELRCSRSQPTRDSEPVMTAAAGSARIEQPTAEDGPPGIPGLPSPGRPLSQPRRPHREGVLVQEAHRSRPIPQGQLALFTAAEAPLLEETGMMAAMTFSEPEADAIPISESEIDRFTRSARLTVPFRQEGPGGLSLVVIEFAPGYLLPRHSHSADCLYYIVEGGIVMGRRKLGPGDGFFLPAEQPYAYHAGPEGVKLLEFRNQSAFDMNVYEKDMATYRAKAMASMEAEAVGRTNDEVSD